MTSMSTLSAKTFLILISALARLAQERAHAQPIEPNAYCPELKRVVALAATTDKFASIAGRPREGNFRDTSLQLTNWRDCSLYGSRSYTCDSQPLQTSDEAEKALATIVGDIGSCLGAGWIEDKSRSSSVYVVLQNAESATSITLSTDLTDKQEHVVRLILFLRGR